MEIRDIIIIGGIIVGFIILIYGVIVLKKMKKENSVSEKIEENNEVATNEPMTDVHSEDDNIVKVEENFTTQTTEPINLSEEVNIVKDEVITPQTIEPEADASELFNKINEAPKENKQEENLLNEDVKLNNSSLDSEIISKPSLETEKEFLEDDNFNTLEEKIEPVKLNEIPSDTSNDNSDVENLF